MTSYKYLADNGWLKNIIFLYLMQWAGPLQRDINAYVGTSKLCLAHVIPHAQLSAHRSCWQGTAAFSICCTHQLPCSWFVAATSTGAGQSYTSTCSVSQTWRNEVFGVSTFAQLGLKQALLATGTDSAYRLHLLHQTRELLLNLGLEKKTGGCYSLQTEKAGHNILIHDLDNASRTGRQKPCNSINFLLRGKSAQALIAIVHPNTGEVLESQTHVARTALYMFLLLNSADDLNACLRKLNSKPRPSASKADWGMIGLKSPRRSLNQFLRYVFNQNVDVNN